MWFIFLFAILGLAIPVALEIHYKGRDNLLVRSGQELATSKLGLFIQRTIGITASWIHAVVAIGLLFLFVYSTFRILSWLLGLIF